jgi:hypothetical protein
MGRPAEATPAPPSISPPAASFGQMTRPLIGLIDPVIERGRLIPMNHLQLCAHAETHRTERLASRAGDARVGRPASGSTSSTPSSSPRSFDRARVRPPPDGAQTTGRGNFRSAEVGDFSAGALSAVVHNLRGFPSRARTWCCPVPLRRAAFVSKPLARRLSRCQPSLAGPPAT